VGAIGRGLISVNQTDVNSISPRVLSRSMASASLDLTGPTTKGRKGWEGKGREGMGGTGGGKEGRGRGSDVVLKTKFLVSRRLEDKK